MDSCDMQEELFVSMMSSNDSVPLDNNRVAEERRYYEMTPEVSSKCRALYDLSGIYADAGLYDEAISVCQEGADNPLLKDYRASLYFRMGQISEHKRDFDAALAAYLESLRSVSANRYLQYWQYNNVAFCYLIQKNFAEAEKHCQTALDIDERTWIEVERRYGESRNWNAWKNMGVAMEHTGRIKEAASFYTTGIKLSRGYERAVLHLRRLLKRHPDLAEAWKEPVQDLLTYYNVIV